MPAFVNLEGRRFGRLLVLDRFERRLTGPGGRMRTFWLTRCDCGRETWGQVNMLQNGHKRSCGCLWDSTQPFGEADMRARLRSYKASAKARGIAWLITNDEFRITGAGPCHYCGVPAIERKLRSIFNGGSIFNGLDRLDSNAPYESRNIVSCCSRCNRIKGDLPYLDFIAMCKQIAARFEEK